MSFHPTGLTDPSTQFDFIQPNGYTPLTMYTAPMNCQPLSTTATPTSLPTTLPPIEINAFPISMKISGVGYLIGTTNHSLITPPTIVQTFGFFANSASGSPGTLSAQLGSSGTTVLTTSKSFTTNRQKATLLRAVLVSSEIWSDDPNVLASAQVQDVTYSGRTQRTTVSISASPSTGGSYTANCNTNTRSSSGQCDLRLSLPPAVFPAQSSTSTSKTESVTISMGTKRIGPLSVTLKSPPSWTLNRNILIQLRAAQVFVGKTYNIPIWGHADYPIQTFLLKFSLGTGLSLVRFDIDTSKWSTQVDGLTLSAVLSDPKSVSQQKVTAPEKLGTMVVKVNGVSGTTISCQVTGLSNSKGEDIATKSNQISGRVADRTQVSTSGSLYVTRKTVVGILPFAANTDLVNSAALLSSTQTTSITITGVYTDGTKSSLANQLSCSSSDTATLRVSTNCRSVFFDKSTTTSSAKVVVTLTYGSSPSWSSTVAFRVWALVRAVEIRVDDAILNAVPMWRNPSTGCQPYYQKTPLRVFATFASNIVQGPFYQVDVTSLVGSRLRSSNPTRLSVVYDSSTGQVVAEGQSAGVVNVNLLSFSTTLARASLAVVETPVQVLSQLHVDVVTSLSLSIPSSPYQKLTTQQASVSIQQLLNFEGTRAGVFAMAVFSDNKVMELTSKEGLNINTTDPFVVSVAGGNTITAVDSGQGDYVTAQWQQAAQCVNATSPAIITQGSASVDVNLPLPISVSVTTTNQRLTFNGDPASKPTVNPLPTSGRLTVRLLYPGGKSKDMTLDRRTVYNTSVSGSALSLTKTGSSVSIQANRSAGLIGSYGILVSFTHVPLTQLLPIQVVQFQSLRLQSHPYPTYTGSSNVLKTTLSLIANTGIFQQALLETDMLLTDTTSIDISTDPAISYKVYSSGTTNPDSSRFRISSSNRLQVKSAATNGNSDIVAIFDSKTSSPLTVTVSKTAVQVTSIDSLVFPATLTGIINKTQSRVKASCTFSDGTRYQTLYSSRGAVLRNLIALSTDNTSAATVDSTSGLVTIRGNSYRQVILAARITSSSAITKTDLFYSNLSPDTLDADLGATSGNPLPPRRIGQQFSVQVRVNLQRQSISTIKLKVIYNDKLLDVLSVSEKGGDWPGGNFLATINDPRGVVEFGGIPSSRLSGTINLCTITFRALAAGTSTLVGSYNVLASSSVNVVPKGTVFVAGNVVQVITGQRKRRDTEQFSHVQAANEEGVEHQRRSRRATTECTSLPCDSCTGGPRETGDVDGNCIFDLRDATFLQTYVLYNATGFSSAAGKAFQSNLKAFQKEEARLDPNLDGLVNNKDAFFLAQVDFRLQRFVNSSSLQVTTKWDGVQQTCQLDIRVQLLQKGDLQASAKQTFLYFDFASSNSIFQTQFDQTIFQSGKKVVVKKGTGLYGGIVRTTSFGSGVFGISAKTAIQLPTFGLSIVLITSDSTGQSAVSRQAVMFSAKRPYKYPHRLDVVISDIQPPYNVIQSQGYSPLLTAPLSSQCIERTTPTTWLPTQVTPATSLPTTAVAPTKQVPTTAITTSKQVEETTSVTRPSSASTSVVTTSSPVTTSVSPSIETTSTTTRFTSVQATRTPSTTQQQTTSRTVQTTQTKSSQPASTTQAQTSQTRTPSRTATTASSTNSRTASLTITTTKPTTAGIEIPEIRVQKGAASNDSCVQLIWELSGSIPATAQSSPLYTVYSDGSQKAVTTAKSALVCGLAKDHEYTFVVQASIGSAKRDSSAYSFTASALPTPGGSGGSGGSSGSFPWYIIIVVLLVLIIIIVAIVVRRRRSGGFNIGNKMKSRSFGTFGGGGGGGSTKFSLSSRSNRRRSSQAWLNDPDGEKEDSPTPDIVPVMWKQPSDQGAYSVANPTAFLEEDQGTVDGNTTNRAKVAKKKLQSFPTGNESGAELQEMGQSKLQNATGVDAYEPVKFTGQNVPAGKVTGKHDQKPKASAESTGKEIVYTAVEFGTTAETSLSLFKPTEYAALDTTKMAKPPTAKEDSVNVYDPVEFTEKAETSSEAKKTDLVYAQLELGETMTVSSSFKPQQKTEYAALDKPEGTAPPPPPAAAKDKQKLQVDDTYAAVDFTAKKNTLKKSRKVSEAQKEAEDELKEKEEEEAARAVVQERDAKGKMKKRVKNKKKEAAVPEKKLGTADSGVKEKEKKDGGLQVDSTYAAVDFSAKKSMKKMKKPSEAEKKAEEERKEKDEEADARAVVLECDKKEKTKKESAAVLAGELLAETKKEKLSSKSMKGKEEKDGGLRVDSTYAAVDLTAKASRKKKSSVEQAAAEERMAEEEEKAARKIVERDRRKSATPEENPTEQKGQMKKRKAKKVPSQEKQDIGQESQMVSDLTRDAAEASEETHVKSALVSNGAVGMKKRAARSKTPITRIQVEEAPEDKRGASTPQMPPKKATDKEESEKGRKLSFRTAKVSPALEITDP